MANKYVIRTNKMHTFYIKVLNLILLTWRIW